MRSRSRMRPVPGSSLAPVRESFEAITERVTPAVVQIFVRGYGPGPGGFDTTDLIDRQESSGSGVLLDPEGSW